MIALRRRADTLDVGISVILGLEQKAS